MAQVQNWRLLRELHLKSPSQIGRPAFVSAASGLFYQNRHLFVVADDEASLAIFAFPGTSPGDLQPLLDRELPLDPVERKKAKPDFESLCFLKEPGFLLAFPSGSKPQRSIACCLEISTSNRKWVDLSGLFHYLQTRVAGELNIEGAVRCRDAVLLFQRGNSVGGSNAVVRLDFVRFLQGVNEGHVDESCFRDLQNVSLGELNGCPLTFTDACGGKDDQILFVAAAEATSNAYDDGEFKGAQVGIIRSTGEILAQASLEIAHKPEGICPHPEGPQNSFLLVTDADDFNVPSLLYEGTLCL